MPSFLPPPSSFSSGSQRKPVDVRTLTLTQLHHFAQRGSRSAKAEIERRMLAADETAAPAPAPAPRPRPAPTVPGELTPRPRPAPTVPGALAPSSMPRHARPTVPGELTPRPRPAPTVPGELTPRPRPAPTVPGELAPRPRPAPTVPGELAPSSTPRHARPTVPGELTPRARPAPARQGVDLDIGSTAAPSRRFTSAPFPSTEMLGALLPMADSPTHPLTQAYSVVVQPEDVAQAAPQAAASADVPPLPHPPAPAPASFPTTEVMNRAQQQPAGNAPQPAPVRETRPRPVFVESRAPSSFVESRAPSSSSEAHAPEEHAHRRHKTKRPEGVPSRPMPLHIPENTATPSPASILDTTNDKVAERLAAISKQESAQNRADDVPRFIGLIIMIWGVLATFSGIIMLANGHGFYVLACGAAVCFVGWLLFKLKRLALPLHAVFLLAALVWAWSGKSSSMLEVLTQSVPLLVPAIWMLIPSIREPLH